MTDEHKKSEWIRFFEDGGQPKIFKDDCVIWYIAIWLYGYNVAIWPYIRIGLDVAKKHNGNLGPPSRYLSDAKWSCYLVFTLEVTY